MNTKKLMSAALLAGSLMLTGVAQAAAVLTFNPSANNTGALNVGGGAAGAIGPQAFFNADNAIVQFSGILDIATNAGVSTWTEAGNLKIVQFNLGVTAVAGSGVNVGGGGSYDIYASFVTSGTGIWAGSTFVVTGINALNVKLYADPFGGTNVVIGNVATSTSTNGGFTPPNSNILLGVSNLLAGPNNGIATISAVSGGQASTSLNALLDFTPSAGTTGANGFFKAPNPFNITIGAGAQGNANNTTWVTNGAGVQIKTNISNPGGGSLAFTSNSVPEPGALSLAGLALLAIGAARRRKTSATV